MFYYRIYGLIVRCNVDMSLLMPVEETEYYDMEISVLYNVLPSSSRIKISEHIDFYRVELCSFAEYKIFKEKACLLLQEIATLTVRIVGKNMKTW